MNKSKPIYYILIIVLVLVAAYFLYKNFSKPKTSNNSEVTNQSTVSPTTSTINSVTTAPSNTDLNYLSDTYKLSFKYPSTWKTSDPVGAKNVTAILEPENIINLVESKVATNTNDKGATLRLIKFILDPKTKINSSSDWLTYIKSKVDGVIANKDLVSQTGYQFISLNKANDINGKWVIVEDYKDNSGMGKDYYFYANGELYQFVFNFQENQASSYRETIEGIVNSFVKN